MAKFYKIIGGMLVMGCVVSGIVSALGVGLPWADNVFGLIVGFAIHNLGGIIERREISFRKE